jgi:hypothetical protein
MASHTQILMNAKDIQIILPNHGGVTFPRVALPERFLRWQIEARREMFALLRQKGSSAIRMQPVHLPVLATLGDGVFPINLATRGIGLLPASEYLHEFTHRFEEMRAITEDLPWAETLVQRIEVAQRVYSRPEHFDPWILGGLEIFEGRTLHNIQRFPLASFLYTGEAPKFPSYQFNVVCTIITNENPYYRFLKAARELFAYDAFHIPQVRYPQGFLFHPVEIQDKTPYSRV